MTEKKAETIRRPYLKPQLEQIQLVPEEAVLVNCKSNTNVGFNAPDHHCNWGTSPCSAFGS